MSTPDRAELQRIAQLVELNRERLQNIEAQVVRLEEARQEQARSIMALEAIPDDGADNVMIPLGGGVQIIADISADSGAVVDIGSGIQAERTREEALEILRARNGELLSLMDSLKTEFDETEQLVIELATQFNEGVGGLQGDAESSPATTNQPTPTKPKAPAEASTEGESEAKPTRHHRKRGTELTLDD